jgi:hypothetical protein
MIFVKSRSAIYKHNSTCHVNTITNINGHQAAPKHCKINQTGKDRHLKSEQVANTGSDPKHTTKRVTKGVGNNNFGKHMPQNEILSEVKSYEMHNEEV